MKSLLLAGTLAIMPMVAHANLAWHLDQLSSNEIDPVFLVGAFTTTDDGSTGLSALITVYIPGEPASFNFDTSDGGKISIIPGGFGGRYTVAFQQSELFLFLAFASPLAGPGSTPLDVAFFASGGLLDNPATVMNNRDTLLEFSPVNAATVVAEPQSLAILGVGLLGLAMYRRGDLRRGDR